MGKYAYVNGQYVRHRDGYVHFDDRGYQFGDGVYEVVTYLDGRPFDADGHWSRLERSLVEMEIPMPFSRRVLDMHVARLARKNKLVNGMVYLQVTRGVCPRNHPIPEKPLTPAVVMTTVHNTGKSAPKFDNGVSVITVPDNRHARRDIKTINLLANCLAKTQAVRAGAYEAVQYEDGVITEASSSNFWIVKDGVLITHPIHFNILCGITRQSIAFVAGEKQYRIEERAFTVDEAYNADEAFVSSASSIVTPVVEMDGKKIGDGTVGPVCKDLLQAMWDYGDDFSKQVNKFIPATTSRPS